MTFMKAVTATPVKTRTENGMVTLESSLNALVDFFFQAAAARQWSEAQIQSIFARALGEDQDKALRLVFWLRDIRGGAGERRAFRVCMTYLEKTNPNLLIKVLPLFAEFGRWDDLLVFQNAQVEQAAFKEVATALTNDNKLVAKWLPREKGTKKALALRLIKFLGWTPREYRKVLARQTQVVESQMCAKEWDQIDYGKVPSVASARYQSAFHKNDEAGKYVAYKNALEKGEAKVNASAIFPHDVIRSFQTGQVQVGRAQWEALPNFIPEDSMILPMVDVSPSMNVAVSGSVRAMDVAVSLGLYIATKNTGPFQNAFLTFSEKPTLEVLPGKDIVNMVDSLRRAAWGMTTDLERAFDLILKTAVNNDIKPEDMPQKLLILSDMQFNQATNNKRTALDMITKKYKKAGYERPVIVYWNINAHASQSPVEAGEADTVLVSGFSPSILKAVLSGDMQEFTPENIMLATIMGDRYNVVSEALA